MKILALRLANLASIPGPLTLDFTTSPLHEAGLFAITGPTGAGKSTLLDALCLALYGNTPRLRQAPSRDSQLNDSDGSSLGTNDPRTLLRRGTASGFAEVDFIGRDGRRYRARWAVRRARDKATGKLQAVEQSLTDLDSEQLLTAQKREFAELLPERLGLNFEQFTRAVLLAQSEFSAFLTANDNERSELLEKLTDTAEYSAISKAAYTRSKAAKDALAVIEAKLADQAPADAETRQTMEVAEQYAEQTLNELHQASSTLDQQQHWLNDDQRLVARLNEGQQQQAHANHQAQLLADQRSDDQWQALIAPERHYLTRHASLTESINRHRQQLEDGRQPLSQSTQALDRATQADSDTEQALNTASQQREQAEPALRRARELTHTLAELDRRLTELNTQTDKRNTEASQLSTQRVDAEAQQANDLKAQRDWQATLSAQLGTHQGEHANFNTARDGWHRAHDAAAHRHLALSELATAWREVNRANQYHQTLKTQQQQDETKLETLKTQGQAARQRLDELTRDHQYLNQRIERLRAVRSESVSRLRQQLDDDTPCPVCGAMEHPWRHHPPATPEAAQLAATQQEEDRQLSEAEQQLSTARDAHHELQGEYRSLNLGLTQCLKALAESESQRNATQQTLATHPLQAEMNTIAHAERDGWINTERTRSQAARDDAAKHLHALNEAEQALAPLAECLRQHELTLSRLTTQQTFVQAERQRLAEQLIPLKAERQQQAKALAEALGEHLSADVWQQGLDTQLSSARQAREQARQQQHAALNTLQHLAQQQQHRQQQLDEASTEHNTLSARLDDWRHRHPELVDATLARLLAESNSDIQARTRRLKEADSTLERTATATDERRRALIEHRHDQALATDAADNDYDNHASSDSHPLLGTAVTTAIKQHHIELEQHRGELAPRLAEAQRIRDAAVNARIDDDRRRQQQRDGQNEREHARQQLVRWGSISELIGAADGKTFRRIAQAWNLERLLEQANLHLAGLTRRYRLERGGSELGLLVIDRDMGDERRSVHSLSGGETFLVSLALALGLASLTSGELAIESLFIDEGFGSLDPQSLALAMEALDGLQAQGRRVGVISHVQEMHERIPVQVRIEPLGNGTSQARITGNG